MKGKFKIIFILTLMILSIMYLSLNAQEVIVWKMPTKNPPESTEGKTFQLFADTVESLSEGRMKIDIYPSEQLGGTDAVLEMIRAGTVHVYPEGVGYLQRYVNEIKIIEMYYLYESRAHWKRFVDSPIAQEWFKKLREEYGIRVLGDITAYERGPYRVLATKRPVLTIEDLQGLKLRMPPNDTTVAIYKELGTDPIILDWTATYESIQRGLVDGCTSPITSVDAMKFQEVAKYLLRTDSLPQGIAFSTNNEAFESLPSDLQGIVLEAHKRACELSVQLMNEIAQELVGRMVKENGVTFIYAPNIDFIKKVEPLFDRWEEEGVLPKGIIEYIAELR